MKKKITSKLALGPMSSEIIEATYSYSYDNSIQLMLIASKNQIDYNGGYVNNWNTAQYADFLNEMDKKYPFSDVISCRDHCGPGFNGNYDIKDSFQTIDADLNAGFDLIHIDTCFADSDHQRKLIIARNLISYIDSDALIEVGTDENVGNDKIDLELLKSDLEFFHNFCDPEFFVVQTGSLIKEINQVGTFDSNIVSKVSKILHKNKVKLKEHNADYLSLNQIKLRNGIVDCMNIAPMLGVIQTNTVMNCALRWGYDCSEFLEKSYRSEKWKKWLYKNDSNNKHLCALIAGHYNFNTTEYKKLYDKLNGMDDIKEIIIENIKDAIGVYIMGMEND